MLCLSLTRSHCLFISSHLRLLHIAVIAVVAVTLLSPSPLLLPPHSHRRPFVDCCHSHHRLVVLSWVPIYPSINMSQSRFLQEEIPKKNRQAANNTAINAAITDLVAARNVRQADGGKRLIKSSNLYKNVIALLQSAGVNIT